MPWNYKPWGCGAGPKGSCNNGWIQFEICEDGLTDKNYFNKVYKEACELTAYLCKTYNLDPKGTTTCGSVKCPVILCHADSYKLGLGSNHGDVLHWFKKHGKTMDDVRNDVAALLKTTTYKVGDVNADGKVNKTDAEKIIEHTLKNTLKGDALKRADYNKDGKVNSSDARAILDDIEKTTNKETYRVRKTWADAASQKGAYTDLNKAKKACDEAGAGYEVYDSKGKVVYTAPSKTTTTQTLKVGNTCKLTADAKFTTGDDVPDWVINSTLYIREVSSDNTVVISTQKTGAITGRVNKKYIKGATTTTTNKTTTTSYQVYVTASKLNVRSGPGLNYKVNTTISKNEVYTIVEEKNGWGKLKSGAGWISLEYTKKR